MKKDFNQEAIQDIIRKTYGEKAVAIGADFSEEKTVCIFWIFSDETEESYKRFIFSR